MRVLAWFSCGVASAVAAKLAVEKYTDRCLVVNCDTLASEHPDNRRFFDDVQRWIGKPITQIRSDKYRTIDDVFERTRYMAGVQGARCTAEMKKIPRLRFADPDDVHVFGFTSEEGSRIQRFEANNPELLCEWPLRDRGWTKSRCIHEISRAGIKIPAMYLMGYRNNNCLGCVKATSANYWNRIRRDFPQVFERRARQSRELGVKLTRYKGKRVFLDELPEEYLYVDEGTEVVSCGPDCGIPGDQQPN